MSNDSSKVYITKKFAKEFARFSNLTLDELVGKYNVELVEDYDTEFIDGLTILQTNIMGGT